MDSLTRAFRGVILTDVPISNRFNLRIEMVKNFNDLINYMKKQNFGDEPTIVAYRNVWADLDHIVREAEINGLNLYNLDFIDTFLEREFAKNLISIENIIYARLIRLIYSETTNTPVRISASKYVSRRDLLRSHIKTILHFINKPIVNEKTCLILPHCNMCIDVCPKKAIYGKPPSIKYDLCDLCGLCISICPVEAIYTPHTTPKAVEEFLSTVRKFSGKSMRIIITRYSLLKDLSSLDPNKIPSTFIIFPVWSLKEVSPLILLRMIYLGFTPVIYSSESLEHLNDLIKLNMISIAKDLSELVVKLYEDKIHGSFRENLPGLKIYAIETIAKFTNKIDLSFPGSGYVELEKNLCTLCGVCVRSCPTEALRILDNGKERRLVLEPYQCIACRECEFMCPEKAVRVKWVFDKDYYESERTLMSSHIIYCSICGTPIETEALILRVEDRLRRAGALEALRYTRTCHKCKTKIVFQEILK